MDGKCALVAVMMTALLLATKGIEITDPAEDQTTVMDLDDLTITCVQSEGGSIQWHRSGMPISETDRISITEENTGGSTVSHLRIERFTEADEGNYKCSDPADYFSTDEVQVNVIAGLGTAVNIVDPSSASMDIEVGTLLTLRCEAAAGVTLVWNHNGMPLATSPTVIITDALDLDTQMMTSMLSRSSVSQAEAGTYHCNDANDIFNEDSVQVNVVDQPGRARVAISQPTGSSMNVALGETFSLRCEGDAATSDLAWFKDGTLVSLLETLFIITPGEDAPSGIKFSMLTREDASEEDSGSYSCQDADDSSNKDTVTVTVGDTGAASGSQASFWVYGSLVAATAFFTIHSMVWLIQY